MKRLVSFILLFSLALCLVSCSNPNGRIIDPFSKKELEKYDVGIDFPRPPVEVLSKANDRLYLNLTEKQYEDYTKKVYEYFKTAGYEIGLLELLKNSSCTNISMLDSYINYDWSKNSHAFYYSKDKMSLEEIKQLESILVIKIERVPDKIFNENNVLTYNTIISFTSETLKIIIKG